MSKEVRTGIGFDVHPFSNDRPLVLGGVLIPGHPGLSGHSDADVLSHAIGDAILGACALGDIGKYFPDSDPRWKDVKSTDILKAIRALAEKYGFRVAFVDTSVVCETPRIAPYAEEMRRNIASALGIGSEYVSVKATTTEGLGFTGRREGIAALATATVEYDATSTTRESASSASAEDGLPGTIFEHAPGGSQKDAEIGGMLKGLAEFHVNTDGASLDNPGPSGCAAVLFDVENVPLCGFGWHIGVATNNVAEYTALLEVLRWIDSLELFSSVIAVRSDSELMIKQLQGEYKVKSDALRSLFAECSMLATKFPNLKLTYVPRAQNTIADLLAKRAASRAKGRKKH